jgi:hypothetical protein
MHCMLCALPAVPHTGALLRKCGGPVQLAVAKDLLSEGLRYEPGTALGWQELGLACQELQQEGRAQQHLQVAALLASSSPVLPYSQLPLF